MNRSFLLFFSHIFKWSVDFVSRLYRDGFHFFFSQMRFNFGGSKVVDYLWKREEYEVRKRRTSSGTWQQGDIANNCFLYCCTAYIYKHFNSAYHLNWYCLLCAAYDLISRCPSLTLESSCYFKQGTCYALEMWKRLACLNCIHLIIFFVQRWLQVYCLTMQGHFFWFVILKWIWAI